LIHAILTDIEGTTSSIAFVKEVLFPYARKHIGDFIETHGADPEVRKLLDEVSAIVGKQLNDAEVVRQLITWIDEDRKVTPLKALQGMIWETGYRQGDFTGHVYEDAEKKLREWHTAGLRLYVFSSGSVTAQKLIFGYSDFGDLKPLFSGYFDTRVGSKRDAIAYQVIVKAIGLPADEILFLSDIAEELDAARSVGMHTLQLVREGALPSPAHPIASDFDQIDLDLIRSD